MTKSISAKILSYVLTVCMTIGVLPSTAFAQEQEFLCGKEVHTHDEQCNDEQGELICQKEEHQHTEKCLPEQIEQDDDDKQENNEQTEQDNDDKQENNEQTEQDDDDKQENNEQTEQDNDNKQADDEQTEQNDGNKQEDDEQTEQDDDDKQTDDEQPYRMRRAARAGDHGDHTSWTELTSSSTINTNGNYYLNEDVKIGQIEITGNIEVTLCLNGHTLTLTGNNDDSDGITVSGGAKLTIWDCGSNGKITNEEKKISNIIAVKETGSTLTLESGRISPTNDKNAVAISGSATFYMKGGAIGGTENELAKGTGVSVVGSTFEMSGGEISYLQVTPGKVPGESGSFNGIGVSVMNFHPIGDDNNVESTFTMTGGIIQGNKSTNINQWANGAGVYIGGSTFTMSDGEIIENGTPCGNGGGVYVSSGTFTMSGGTISNNKASGEGGGMFVTNSATFNMEGGKISENEAASGGGVCINASDLDMSSGTISGNISGRGGGIFISNAYDSNKLSISGGTISENKADSASELSVDGGGIYVSASSNANGEVPFTISGSTVISGNTADNGGGVYIEGVAFTMEGGTIDGNTATKDGGGVYIKKVIDELSGSVSKGTFTMKNGTISKNKADNGGGVFSKGTFTMEGGIISENTATNDGSGVDLYTGGGGVYVSSSEFTMNGGTISGNIANNRGGGIFNNGTFTMTNGTISNNTADDGGGVFNNITFTMEDGTISENTAKGDGGGVLSSGTFTMNGGTISENTANSNGGGVRNVIEFTMNGGIISENTAKGNGGGVHNYSTFTMTNGTISKNTAKGDGGGVYNDDTFTMEDGTISENIKADGTTPNNVYLLGNGTNGVTIKVKDNIAPNTSKKIGITTQNLPADDGSILVVEGIDGTNDIDITSYREKFVSDNDEYEILSKGETNKLYLVAKPAPIFDYYNGKTPKQQLTKPDDTTWNGYIFYGWYTEPYAQGEKLEEDDTPKRGRTYYACWKTDNTQNAKFVVTQPLDFTSGAPNTSDSPKYPENNGITWENNTLTLDGAVVDTSEHQSSSTAITLPAGATIDIKGQYGNKIISNSGAISGAGNIILEGNAVSQLSLSGGTAIQATKITVNTISRITHSVKNSSIIEIPSEGVNSITATDNTKPVVIQFDGATYTVRFVDGNSTLSTSTVGYGNTISDAPTPSSKEGYTFKGWAESENGTILNMNSYTVTKDVTLYAVWEQNTTETYTVTFKDGDTELKTVTVAKDSAISYTPTKDGYIFKGWAESENGIILDMDTYTVTKNVTLYAVWEQNTTPIPPVPSKPSYSVSGTVSYEDGEPAANVSVSLNGNKTTTDSQGKYTFYGVKAGNYVVSVSAENGSGTKTIAVSNANITNADIVIVKWGTDTEIVENGVDSRVDGLEEEAKRYAEEGALVKLVLKIDKQSRNNADVAQNSIRAISKQSEQDFFVVKLEKVVMKDGKTTVTELYDTQTTLQITVDCDASEKQNVTAYRYCNSVAEKLKASNAVNDGNYRMKGNNVSIYTNTMGNYAIGYDEKEEEKQYSNGKTGSWVKEQSEQTRQDNTEQTIPNTQQPNQTTSKCPKDASCPLTKFTDVNLSEWYHDGIHYCVENGLMSGISSSLFDPNQPTSRAMIIAMLWRLENKPIVNETMQFTDVPQNAYYTEAVKWAVSIGIISGYDNTTFAPNDNITREQMASIFYRYTQYKGRNVNVVNETVLSNYTDLSEVSGYALQAMKWACDAGIINGISAQMLSPKGYATRAQVAQMFKNYLTTLQ